MHYSTINATKIDSKTDLAGFTKHCLREGGPDAKHHRSVPDPTKSHLNQHYVLNDALQLVQVTTENFSLNDSLNKLAESKGAKFRKGGHVGTELCVGASREWMLSRTPEQKQEWVQKNLEAIEERFPGMTFGASFHADETNPHMHVYLLPTYTKQVNRGERKDGKPSRRKPRVSVSHNKVMPHYQQLHDWYNKAMRTAGYALLRGRPKTATGFQNEPLERAEDRAQRLIEEAKKAAKDEVAHSKAMVTYAGLYEADAKLAAAQIRHDAQRQLEIAANAKADILKDWEIMREGVKTFKALDELSKFLKSTVRMLEAYKSVLPREFFSGKPSKIDDLNEHLEFIETLNRTEIKKEITETVKEAQPIFNKHNNTENEKPRGLSF